MFIDEINLHFKAGRGGDGVVRWRHEKGKEFGGPSGGNGGRGGSVYARAIRDIGVLSGYRNVKVLEAGDGENGAKDLKQGGTGLDIEVKLPVGARLTNLTTGHIIELLKDGERVKLLEGGKGGLGNAHFKASTNVRPRESTSGEDGEEAEFHIELLLVADVGLIGLPNAGKSSLLNTLTSAHAKVGDFPFTTLEPNLGDLYGLILADIPGLIEGAHTGKGLGHKFLKHIERTKAILHCVSVESENPEEAYKVVRRELELYNRELMDKPEVVVLTKTDMVSEKERKEKTKILEKVAGKVLQVSILDDELIKKLGDHLTSKFGSTSSPQVN